MDKFCIVGIVLGLVGFCIEAFLNKDLGGAFWALASAGWAFSAYNATN